MQYLPSSPRSQPHLSASQNTATGIETWTYPATDQLFHPVKPLRQPRYASPLLPKIPFRTASRSHVGLSAIEGAAHSEVLTYRRLGENCTGKGARARRFQRFEEKIDGPHLHPLSREHARYSLAALEHSSGDSQVGLADSLVLELVWKDLDREVRMMSRELMSIDTAEECQPRRSLSEQ